MHKTLWIVFASLLTAGSLLAQEKEKTMVQIVTSLGTMKLELYPEQAPATVSNFLAYVDSGFFDGTIFHRVIRNFMIQGGGFDPDMIEKPTNPPIVNEAANGLKNTRGTIAMARTMIPNSATSQFFINTVSNPSLDFRSNTPQGIGYCVFGKVVEGEEVLDAIQSVRTGFKRGMQDVPVETVLIERISRMQPATETAEEVDTTE
jgi:cyclophilin family peptidyl-prolyl cis-trans isomerase